MRRLIHVNALVLLAFAIWAPSAHADWWDWLDELSGPGIWHSRGNLAATVWSKGGGWAKQQPLSPDTKWAERTYIFADVRRFKNKDDRKFFDSRMEIYEGGAMIRLFPQFDVGIGAGLMHIDSSGGTGRKINKATITIPRQVIKPLLFVPKWKDPDLGFFQIYFREDLVLGKLTASDFNPKPGTTFESHSEFVSSAGGIIDISLAVRALAKGIKKIH